MDKKMNKIIEFPMEKLCLFENAAELSLPKIFTDASEEQKCKYFLNGVPDFIKIHSESETILSMNLTNLEFSSDQIISKLQQFEASFSV